jgi:hypothetical protein
MESHKESAMAFEVFVSYAHEDRDRRNKLAAHLSNLRKQGKIADWYDGDIGPGTEWKTQIFDHLDSAHLILLLISADFMASDFCYSVELKRAIERHEAHQARVIPIILRPTDWEGAPFAKLKVLPTDGKPISEWSSQEDGAFLEVVKGIRQALADLQEHMPTSPPVVEVTPVPSIEPTPKNAS